MRGKYIALVFSLKHGLWDAITIIAVVWTGQSSTFHRFLSLVHDTLLTSIWVEFIACTNCSNTQTVTQEFFFNS